MCNLNICSLFAKSICIYLCLYLFIQGICRILFLQNHPSLCWGDFPVWPSRSHPASLPSPPEVGPRSFAKGCCSETKGASLGSPDQPHSDEILEPTQESFRLFFISLGFDPAKNSCRKLSSSQDLNLKTYCKRAVISWVLQPVVASEEVSEGFIT